jgi:hypothetical protein
MSLPATIAGGYPDQMQMPDVRRLERMPSLPAWVASRIASIKIEHQPDGATGKSRAMPTLPRNLTLIAAEREEVARHAAELRELCNQTPACDPQAERDTLLAVTKMMLVLPSMTQNELSAEARGEAYLAALEDLPTWAVQAAVRRWYRGSCGKNAKGEPYDYHWCPAPAELRRISFAEMHRIKGRADELESLLAAQPRIEFSEEHCRAMRARLAGLFRNMRTPLVGETAAVEAVGQ